MAFLKIIAQFDKQIEVVLEKLMCKFHVDGFFNYLQSENQRVILTEVRKLMHTTETLFTLHFFQFTIQRISKVDFFGLLKD